MEDDLWIPSHQTPTAPSCQLLAPLNPLKTILAHARRSPAPAQPFWHPTTSRVTPMLTTSSTTLFGIQVPRLPPDFHGLLVVGAEEVVGAVMLHRLPAILAHVENCTGKAKTIKIRSVHQHSSAVQHPKMTFSTDQGEKSLGMLTFCWDADPVEVASQLLGDVGLPPGREANHHYHSGGIGELRPTGYKEEEEKAKHQQLLMHQLISYQPCTALAFEPASSRSFGSWKKPKASAPRAPSPLHPPLLRVNNQDPEQGNPPAYFHDEIC